MGEVIGKGAAGADQIADVRTTLHNAAARGGQWQALAEQKLRPVLVLYENIADRSMQIEEALAPLEAAFSSKNEAADFVIGKVSDDVWNALGRPGQDPAYDLLFPGGIRYYSQDDDSEQPDRMEVLAELLEGHIHPRLDPVVAERAAAELRTAAIPMRAAAEQMYQPRLRIRMLRHMGTVVAKAARNELVNLKRRYKSEGFSEADIHAVIPDRSTSTPPAPSAPAV